MSDSSRSNGFLVVCAIVALLAGGLPGSALAKTHKVDCTKQGDLQKAIDAAASGDSIEITGVCMTNIVIRDKALTLTGATAPGPHGITGVAANTDGVRIENSRGTHLEGLVISNPLFTGVRIRFFSEVTMTDCEVSDNFAGSATGIWVQESSTFDGTRLRLDGDLHGLGAYGNSRARCYECDINASTSWAVYSLTHSSVTLLDSEVTGNRGLLAADNSYADIDCEWYSSGHACSLTATQTAGTAAGLSAVRFLESGDFDGRLLASDRSEVGLVGARQVSTAANNRIDSGSSLRVEPGESGSSRLMGHTDVTGFSHALFYGAGTVLEGSLTCSAGGDAWVEPGINLTAPGYAISGCDHAP
jgi:hypothetical protein